MNIKDPKRSLEELLEGVEGWMPLPEANLLRELAQKALADVIEIGCYRGRSTIALALGISEAKNAELFVHSIDPHRLTVGAFGGKFGPNDRKMYYKNMLSSDLSAQAALINMPSEKVGQVWDSPIGLLFIDGDHRYEAVRRDIDIWSPHLLTGGIVVFDDAIGKDNGPTKVVCELLQTPEFETYKIVGKIHALRKR